MVAGRWWRDWWRGAPAALWFVSLSSIQVVTDIISGDGFMLIITAILLAIPIAWGWPDRAVLVRRGLRATTTASAGFLVAVFTQDTVVFSSSVWKAAGALGAIIAASWIGIALVATTGTLLALGLQQAWIRGTRVPET